MKIMLLLRAFVADIYVDITLLFGLVALGLSRYAITPRVAIGLVITIAACVFWIIARIQLGNAFSVTPKATALVIHGLYSKISHPMYLFSTVALIGIVIAWPFPLLIGLLLFLAIIQTLRAYKENRRLRSKFGRQYDQYRDHTWI